MTKRDSTSASRRTPFTVQACTPKGRHLHPFDWIRWRGFWQAGPTRRTLGRWWLLGCTCILGREGQDVQPFGASDGLGKDAFGLGPVGEELARLPAQQVAVVPAPLRGCALGNERVLSKPTSSSPPPPPERAKADAHRSACALPTIHPRSGLGLKEPVPVPGVVAGGQTRSQ